MLLEKDFSPPEKSEARKTHDEKIHRIAKEILEMLILEKYSVYDINHIIMHIKDYSEMIPLVMPN